MTLLVTLACLAAPAAIVAVVQAIENRKLRLKADGTYGRR